MTEWLYHVDEQDNVLGRVSREETHAKNFLHRTVHACVFNGKGDLYISQRSLQAERLQGYWDAMAEHTNYGETQEAAVVRGFREEYGIQVPERDLVLVSKCRVNAAGENILYWLFRIVYDGPIVPRGEVEQGDFFSLDQIREKIAEEDFCPWFLESFKRF